MVHEQGEKFQRLKRTEAKELWNLKHTIRTEPTDISRTDLCYHCVVRNFGHSVSEHSTDTSLSSFVASNVGMKINF